MGYCGKDSKTMKKFEDEVRKEFQFLDYAQIAFVSAKRTHKITYIIPLH